MKILLICEDDDVSCAVCDAIDAAVTATHIHAEIITYRYLLKALDNVEEINPDAVVINAVDYPLHWKTFAEYTLCMGLCPVTALYVSRRWDEGEAAKAVSLGVFLTFCSIDDTNALYRIAQQLLQRCEEKDMEDNDEQAELPINDTVSTETHSTSNEDATGEDVPQLIFTHPHSEAFVVGKVVSVDGNNIVFAPDFPALTKSLVAGDVLDEVSYKVDGVMHCISATIAANNSDGEMLTIQLESA